MIIGIKMKKITLNEILEKLRDLKDYLNEGDYSRLNEELEQLIGDIKWVSEIEEYK